MQNFFIQGPFSFDCPASDALAYLSELRKTIAEFRAKEDQLRKDLGLFDLSLTENPDLLRLEKVIIM